MKNVVTFKCLFAFVTLSVDFLLPNTCLSSLCLNYAQITCESSINATKQLRSLPSHIRSNIYLINNNLVL